MRDVTEADVPRMSFEDNDWSAEQFLELLGTPGAVGLIEDGDFVLGLAIGEEGDQAFYAIRVRLTDADTEADIWRELTTRYERVCVELQMEDVKVTSLRGERRCVVTLVPDHGHLAARLHDLGFEFTFGERGKVIATMKK